MNSYDEWKLQERMTIDDDSFEEEFSIVGENAEDYNLFEEELEELLEKYGYKRG